MLAAACESVVRGAFGEDIRRQSVQFVGCSARLISVHGFLGDAVVDGAAARTPWLHHHSAKGTTMTQPHPDANAVPPEGYDRPAVPPYQGGVNPTVPQPQQPYAGPQQPYQQQGHPAGPQQPYAGQPQYQAYPPAPQHPQYQQQPPMPNPAYGYAQPKSKIVAGLLASSWADWVSTASTSDTPKWRSSSSSSPSSWASSLSASGSSSACGASSRAS